MIYKLKCQYCGEPFSKKGKPRQKFCSIQCGSRARRQPEPNIAKEGWTPELAYFAGLIWSDGCLSKDSSPSGYRVTLTLTDKGTVEALKPYVSPHRKLYVQRLPSRKPKYTLVTQQEEVVAWFISQGLSERKSKSLGIPSIPENCLPHFVRGYFDGDGSVFRTKKDSNRYLGLRFTCADQKFLEWLQQHMQQLDCKLSLTKDNRKDVWYLSTYSRQHIKRIASWMYCGGICMTRKKLVFQDSDMV